MTPKVTNCHQICGGHAGCNSPWKLGEPISICLILQSHTLCAALLSPCPLISHPQAPGASRASLPGMGCDAVGWVCPHRPGEGHLEGPGASFASLPGQSSLGTHSPWEPWLSPTRTSPGEGHGSRTDPTLFRVAKAKVFPSCPWRQGSVLALLGDRGCQAGCSPAPEQPGTGSHSRAGEGSTVLLCPPQPWQQRLKERTSYLGRYVAQLHPSCQSDLAPLTEG